MRIAYCTNVRLPSERAHGHQIAQVCDALTRLGHDVTVYAPYRRNTVTADFHEYYGVSGGIRLAHLGTFDPIDRWWLPGVTGLWVLNALLKRAYRRTLTGNAFDLLYTRVPALLDVLIGTGIPVVLELHRLPSRGHRAFVERCNKCRLVVCLTSAMRDELVALGADASRVIVEGDAVDLAAFQALPSAADAKNAWSIPAAVPVIGYAGQLASMGLSKGLPELLGALKILHLKGIVFRGLIAGGPESTRKELEAGLSADMRARVTFVGTLERARIPSLLAACDVLVYPAPRSDHPYYVRDTSPLKLFEYMASGRPVVCADLPPLRDIVDAGTVTLCEPGDPSALAAAIESVLADPAKAMVKAEKAHDRVTGYTWPKRMSRILEAATMDT